ncbi:MAG: MerR family transcriptional regulator [Longimicrobiales bacterium]
MDQLSIGQVARRADVTPEAIRYYERRGVLQPARRDAAGYRRYGARAIDELRLLKAAQAVGFSLDEITRMLALTREDPIRCRSMCELVEGRITELDARIRELTSARERLAGAVDACHADDVCAIPEHLRIEPSA